MGWELSMSTPAAKGNFPQLSPRVVTALLALMTQSLYNPEFAADLFVNPREEFLSYNFTEQEMNDVRDYFKYVNTLVNRDHNIDWY
jgi:hypothetical protein